MKKIICSLCCLLATVNFAIADDCSEYEQYQNKPYNVYLEETGKKVVYNNKIYEVGDDYIPENCHPESAWSYLWNYIGTCGEGGSEGSGGNEQGNAGADYEHNTVSCLKKHLIIGYWHNFNNNTMNGLKLSEINNAYDVINVSFGETDASDRAVITFAPDNSIYATEAAFIADIQALQAQGKKVNLSLGGQNGIIHVANESDKTKFVNSVIAIIEKYGFDGLDIDFEGTSAGGYSSSFINPNANAQLMIDGIREICEHFGNDFLLTMAPETAYVQFGINQGQAPAYLALIYGLRDKLTVLHVQLYNTGSSNDLYGNSPTVGTADYLVAMTEMLLQGFPCCGTTFPALDESQVAIGIPACTGAAGSGIVTMENAKKAMQYLITGVKPAGMNYTLKNPNGYPDFRGIMTWSVNWDASNNYELANTFDNYFDEIGNPVMNCGETSDNEAPTAPSNLAATPAEKSVALSWDAATDNIGVKGYNIYKGDTKIGYATSCTYTATGLTAETAYTFYVEAYDAAGNKSSKTSVQTTTLESTGSEGGEGGEGGGEDDYGECTEPAWDETKNYQTPGEKVSYKGKIYKVKSSVWWTTAGLSPDTNTNQWDYVSNCDGTGGNSGEGGEGGSTIDPVDTGIDYENGKRFVIYFPNWGNYNPTHLNITVSMIPWEKVTHINHAFFQVADNYTLESTDKFIDFDKAFEHSEGWEDGALRGHFAEYKHYKQLYPGVKLLVSVGGWTKGHNFHAMALTQERRTIFINSVIAFLQQYPFVDGIDIDWEYPGVNRAADPNDTADKGCPGGPEDAVNYVALLKELREAFNANNMQDKLLTVAASINQNVIAQGANPSNYAQYLDYINLMSYDLHGAFERTTNHHGAIYANPNDPSETALERETFNASAAAAFFAANGFPKSKIVVGSPWYSRGWGGVSAGPNGDGLFQPATGYERGKWDDPYTSTPGGQYPWFDCKKLETTAGWTKYTDEYAKVPYLFNASQGIFLTYEDETSLAERCDFVINNDYGGIIVWEISGDDLNNGAPLSTIIYNKFYAAEQPTGIDYSTTDSAFECSVSPNPATEFISIKINKDAAIAIYDLFGKCILTKNIHAGDNTIRAEEVGQGWRIIRILDGEKNENFIVLVK